MLLQCPWEGKKAKNWNVMFDGGTRFRLLMLVVETSSEIWIVTLLEKDIQTRSGFK